MRKPNQDSNVEALFGFMRSPVLRERASELGGAILATFVWSIDEVNLRTSNKSLWSAATKQSALAACYYEISPLFRAARNCVRGRASCPREAAAAR